MKLLAPAVAVLALLAFPCLARPARAQTPHPDTPVDATLRRAVLDTLAARLEALYVFPDVGREMAKALRRRAARHEYDGITSADAFTDSLSAHLYAVAHDLHLRVFYSPEPVPPRNGEVEPTREDAERIRPQLRLRNFGFEKVQRLAGNVGYLELRSFELPGFGAGEVATAAMGLLANSDALIVDLRRNGGGDPAMIALLISYLYAPWQRIHLNDFYQREGGRLEQYWTQPHVPGTHLADQDVYVLTSRATGSGAEEFAYDLKSLKRATLVGETTAGAANPGDFVRVGEHFGAFIPTGRAINPVTHTNWEGVGVVPDVACSADTALAAAHTLALQKLLERAGGEADRARLTRALEVARRTPPDPLEAPYRMRH
jgi:hypothetical protein